MKLGAYQFNVTGDIRQNLTKMLEAISVAAQKGVELLVFPECSLTGYPPHDFPNASAIDADTVDSAIGELFKETDKADVAVLFGSILKDCGNYYNAAIFRAPNQSPVYYHKRALWGWDADNFTAGDSEGVILFGGLTIGVRICFEIRFPEYFRELYRVGTDFNIILFYDRSQQSDTDRYNLLLGHIRTRAVENVCPVLTVNTTSDYQSAPTCLVNASGHILAELPVGDESLLVYDFSHEEPDFGEMGRKTFSDKLCL